MNDDALDLSVGPDGYYHPSTEEQIQALIRRARREGKKLRVRGAAHSVPASIATGASAPKRGASEPVSTASGGIDVMLDRYAAISIDREKKQVTVQAGCHLGKDPFDPTGTSTIENSLFHQLNQAGLAVPDMGGISHQTISGFISTGCSGGTLSHAFHDQIIGLRIIDGTGAVHDLSEARDADLFHAAGVSMGLLGVISTVTLQCVDRYDIRGQEAITRVRDAAVDLFGDGAASLGRFLERTEYTRLVWWPQRGAEKLVVWQAHQMKDDDYDDETGPRGELQRKPYKEVLWILGSPIPAEIVADLFYTLVGTFPDWLHELVGGGIQFKVLKGVLESLFEPVILPATINAFVPVDKDGPQTFWDSWWQGLPLDNQINDKLLPTAFTELWIPIRRAREAMQKLRDHYEENGLSATGTFCCEIYGAKRSPFWMSPAYGEDVVRLDFFWFEKNKANPVTDYYPQFWELFKEFDYRLHWGKYLSGDAAYLRARYPRWDDFMKTREALDPDQIFVTDYWRKHLAIPAPSR